MKSVLSRAAFLALLLSVSVAGAAPEPLAESASVVRVCLRFGLWGRAARLCLNGTGVQLGGGLEAVRSHSWHGGPDTWHERADTLPTLYHCWPRPSQRTISPGQRQRPKCRSAGQASPPRHGLPPCGTRDGLPTPPGPHPPAIYCDRGRCAPLCRGKRGKPGKGPLSARQRREAGSGGEQEKGAPGLLHQPAAAL
jgi:hypothetical protein